MRRVLSLAIILAGVLLVAGGAVLAGPHGPWIKDAANPVLLPGPAGSWDGRYVYGQAVIKDGARYQMWYIGFDESMNSAIGYATSTDGIAWNKYAHNPVLVTGSSGSWDGWRIYDPTVVKVGGTYHMWYRGHSAAGAAALEHPTLPDLITTGSIVAIEHTAPPALITTGGTVAIGHATSPDGITWTKDPANPVLTPGPSGSWDSKAIYAPTAVNTGASYHLWYTAQDAAGSTAIGRATSPDGSTWTKDPANPNLLPGARVAWGRVGLGWPSVVHDGAAAFYHMTFNGYDGAQNTFGHASSSDGRTWAKSAANPVLRPGPGASWDSDWIFDSTVLHNGVTYEMWYTGQRDGAYAIGRAFTEASRR